MPKIKVRARAVDMLGRQQIAGIPTAIHELFKNAHDAYAERAEIDYFRRNRVLILRDDGYGMTKYDVEDRWLTLGTESRIGANRPDPIETWTGPKKLPRRTIMGEKGIGRLAIGVIAPVTLLMTRAVREDGLHDLVVALVHWGIFEQPGLDISAIDVPVVEFPGGSLPTREDVRGLVSHVRNNIEALKKDLSPDASQKLLTDLDAVESIAPDRLDNTLRQFLKKDEEPLSLAGDGYGTHFILMPTAPELNDDIDGGSEQKASDLRKFLLGFSNTMTGKKPVICTQFRDHHLDEYPAEQIGPNIFFLPEEYEKADHHFSGKFDEYGQFTGTVRIYGETKPFVCNWPTGRGKPIKCGPFSIDFAYIMGDKKETGLSPDDHAKIIGKLNRIGGLYIYRDSIRVLPYGNPDVDFLEIEERRNRSMKDWFFSRRRIFGYIAITHEHNGTLHEKAGREGFRQNQSYRDFRAVLINFFQRLAVEFFKPGAPQGESFWDKKNVLTSEAKLLEKQKKKADNRRKNFKKLLDQFFQRYENGQFEQDAEQIRHQIAGRLEKLLLIDDVGDLATEIKNLEAGLSDSLAGLRRDVSITMPRGLALTGKLERDWAAYQRLAKEVRAETIEPLQMELFQFIRAATDDQISDAQHRDAVLHTLESRRDNLTRDLSALRRDAYAATEEMRKVLKQVVREEFSEFRETMEELLIDFTRKVARQPEELDQARILFEQKVSDIRERETALLEAIRRQMQDFSEALAERETIEDRTGALEQRAQRLEEQLDFYSDFAQMGMAVGILQHEFEKTAQNMRTTMRDLKPWADGTPELKKVYQRLRNSFDHLDGYLKLLDPLGRRLYRTKVELSGDEIRLHLLRIFRQALDDNGIILKTSDEFLARTVKCRSSALLGAFINIVDNAIYWVANGATGEKNIYLDVDDKGFLISNSGPGIEKRFRERIFEFGETTKPGGRGMGLAISRDTLHREGFDIELIQAGSNVRPIFRINTMTNKEEDVK